VLEHHFDNHEHCGDWCRRKDLTEDQRKESNKFYRCKVKDKSLHEWLQQNLAQFLTLEALKEVGHGMDELVNESFNNTVAWLAPKNKVYSGSLSLRNRIDIATCVTTLGLKVFYEETLEAFGTPVTEDIGHFLQIISNKRDKRIAKTKSNEAKKTRQEKFHAKLKEHTDGAKKDRDKADGTCRPGVGMDGGYNDEDFDNNNNKKKRKRTIAVCQLCGLTGHKTSRSKKCKCNKANPNYVGNAAAEATTTTATTTAENTAPVTLAATVDTRAAQMDRDAEECDVMDQQPLDDSSCEAFWSAEEGGG